MNLQILTGKISRPQKLVLYGAPGGGKSTMAANAPGRVVCLDGEDGTAQLDVARILVRSVDELEALRQRINPAKLHAKGVRTFVVDTIDAIEKLLREKIVRKYRVESIGQIRYGNGFVFWREEFGRFLSGFLDSFIVSGIHVVVVCHSTVRRIQPPGLREPFDRYEPKLNEPNWHALVEWSDSLLFYTFDLRLSNTGEGKPIGLGGKERHLYTQYSPAWEAKCRLSLPEKIVVPNDLKAIAGVFAPFFGDYASHLPAPSPLIEPSLR
jgi:hypothetical protein